MSVSPLIGAIRNRLRESGYSDLPTPLQVAGIEFEFTGAMRGSEGRGLDLVLLVDTTTGDFGDRNGGRVRQRIEALSRALDVTGSRYVVTTILGGAALTDGVEALSEVCRVLHLEGVQLNEDGKPIDDAAQLQLDDRIRVLLPLTLPNAVPEGLDGSRPAIDQLVSAIPPGSSTSMVNALIMASTEGEQAVTNAVARMISEALQVEGGAEQ